MTDQNIFTLPEIAKRVGAEYRTLHLWARDGLIAPSVRKAGGPGRAGYYSRRDVRVIAGLVELRKRGMSLDALKEVAAEWSATEHAVCPACTSSIRLPVFPDG